MGAALHGDSHSLFSLEKLLQIFFPGSDLAGFHHFTILVQPAVMAPPVADIDARRTVGLGFFGLRFFDTLLHKAGLLCIFECVADSIIACSARPAVSFHLKPECYFLSSKRSLKAARHE